MGEYRIECSLADAGLVPRCYTQVRFPLGSSQWDHNWLATRHLHNFSALRRACPGGSDDFHATAPATVVSSPARKPGGEQKKVMLKMMLTVPNVARQLSLPLGQAQRKRAAADVRYNEGSSRWSDV